LFPQKKNKKNSLASNFFFSSIFAAYQKIKKLVISFGYCPKYISCIKNKKKRVKRKTKKNSSKKTFIGFCVEN